MITRELIALICAINETVEIDPWAMEDLAHFLKKDSYEIQELLNEACELHKEYKELESDDDDEF